MITQLKTRTAINIVELLVNRNPDAFVLIVVPTEIIKNQWVEQLIERNLFLNCKVEIINTVVKNTYNVDLLILDEVHSYASSSYSAVFDVVEYKLILSLTATLERLDGKEELIKEKSPICDEVSIEEAIQNGWLSPFKEYCVLLDVDLTEYNEWDRKFNGFFSSFGWDFNLAMKCVTKPVTRAKVAKQLGIPKKQFDGICYGWMKCLKSRKAFITSHPKKLEIAEKILNFRKDKKCLTFSATIKDAEKFKSGYVLHSKKSKKENKKILEKFNEDTIAQLHSSRACEVGMDLKGVNTEIILFHNSSKIRHKQILGRTIRFEEGKVAEIFNLVLKGTQDYKWFQNSATSNYIVINEEQLDKVLNYENIETRERETIENKTYRF